MNLSDLTTLRNFVRGLKDDQVWVPLANEPSVLQDFKSLVEEVEDSKKWPASRNHEKGKLFEKLIRLVLSRFSVGDTDSDFTVGDNQIDHEFKFIDDYITLFTEQIGRTIVCECKNEQSPVDVSYISKLIELCETRESRFGIFFSIVGLTGRGWIYAEGKRKKNFLRKKLGIISFSLKEIKELENSNLFTLIKNKYQNLIDEIDDESDDIRKYSGDELQSFSRRLKKTTEEMKKLNLISEEI